MRKETSPPPYVHKGVFSPGHSVRDTYLARVHVVDGYAWAYLTGDLVINVQQWVIWGPGYRDWDLGSGYRYAVLAEESDAEQIATRLSEGEQPQWRELIQALQEDRRVRLAPPVGASVPMR